MNNKGFLNKRTLELKHSQPSGILKCHHTVGLSALCRNIDAKAAGLRRLPTRGLATPSCVFVDIR